MLLSQFQEPAHFLMAYLEDYKMDPHSATPLLTFSVFDDLAASKNLTLVRCDVLNKNIQYDEALRVVQSVLDNYRNEHEFASVETFNDEPNSFDVDDYVSRMNDKWKQLQQQDDEDGRGGWESVSATCATATTATTSSSTTTPSPSP